MQLRNGHAWAPADVSRASLRLVRQLAGDDDGGRSGLRLVSELHLGEARERDPDACAAVLGHAAAGLPPGGLLLLRRSTRCGFDFVPFRPGDRVQLLLGAPCLMLRWPRLHVTQRQTIHAGDNVVDEHIIDAHSLAADADEHAHDGAGGAGSPQHARARLLAADSAALQAASAQSLAAAFASFAVAGSAQPPPAPPVVIAPRRTSDAGACVDTCARVSHANALLIVDVERAALRHPLVPRVQLV